MKMIQNIQQQSHATFYAINCVKDRQRGFSLISAIFLLVVIAALGTFAVTVSTTQQQSTALDVMGSRAYQASRAGIEWGAFQVLRNTAGAFATACLAGTPSQALTGLPNTLANFTVAVTCSSVSTTDGGTPLTVYQLTSTANQGVSPSYVERVISVTIAK
jgi:MSHA biogenesis protein MshP